MRNYGYSHQLRKIRELIVIIHCCSYSAIVIIDKYNTSLISSEGAFSGVVDSMVLKNFMGGSPRPPNEHCMTMRPIY